VEFDTWKGRENLKNAKEAIKEFKREYQRDMEDVARQERKEGTFRRGELPGRFTARKLFGWSDKRYDQEYWGRLERNWKRWKGKQPRRMMETIEEEKEIEQGDSELREWTEDDDDEMGNIVDLDYEL